MAIHPIKQKHGKHTCSWCNNQAIHRCFGFTKVACKDHYSELEAYNRRENMPDYSDAAFYGGF